MNFSENSYFHKTLQKEELKWFKLLVGSVEPKHINQDSNIYYYFCK